jgi:beta-galactosidase
VELFLNNKSLGKHTKVPLSHIEWKVPFQKGELRAKGFFNGVVAAENIIKTAGTPSELKISADRMSIKADGEDLSFITVEVCDEKGNTVPTADNVINVEVSGGKLLGLCSGNPKSHENPGNKSFKAFNGLLLAVVQSYDSIGEILVKLNSEGLKSNEITISTI